MRRLKWFGIISVMALAVAAMFFGLCVVGTVHPDKIATNAGARPGDALVLTKPLGSGYLCTAIKKGTLPEDIELRVMEVMATLNRAACEAMLAIGVGPTAVHAATDVTGFGLLGHACGVADASGATLRLFLHGDVLGRTHPTYAMLTADRAALHARAEALALRLRSLPAAKAGRLEVDVVDAADAVGAGSLPTVVLPGAAVRLVDAGVEAGEMARRLRAGDVPVFTTVKDHAVHVHVRTLLPGDEDHVAHALAKASP